MAVDWSYFDKFDAINKDYLPSCGEGRTMATQAVTAVNKLIYKWYNDGDVYDNTYGMDGWCNDLSSYANWLTANIEGVRIILERIYNTYSDGEYEDILKALADFVLSERLLERLGRHPVQGSVYDCDGPFVWEDQWDEDEDEDEYY